MNKKQSKTREGKCVFCGKTYDEHEDKLGVAVPRMPCLGVKKGFYSNLDPEYIKKKVELSERKVNEWEKEIREHISGIADYPHNTADLVVDIVKKQLTKAREEAVKGFVEWYSNTIVSNPRNFGRKHQLDLLVKEYLKSLKDTK